MLGGNDNGNFIQLLTTVARYNSRIYKWLEKKKISLLIQQLTHSSLQLAKGDTIKAIKSMRDAFDKVFVEWNKPIKYSP